MMMNPALTRAVVREREADLRRVAAIHSRQHLVRHRPRPQPRQRIGWLLIEVGLRLTAVPQH